MASKRKTRKFGEGGNTDAPAGADAGYRKRNSQYETPEPGLQQADKEATAEAAELMMGSGATKVAGRLAKAATAPSKATRRAEMGERIVARKNATAVDQAMGRSARRGVDPRNTVDSQAKDWRTIMGEKSLRTAKRAGKRAEEGYDPRNAYKKGGAVKKYASGGDIAPMSAMPSGKQLKENIEAQKQSEAERQARYKAVKAAAAAASPANKKACGGTIKKYARGGGIEAKGKTRGKIC